MADVSVGADEVGSVGGGSVSCGELAGGVGDDGDAYEAGERGVGCGDGYDAARWAGESFQGLGEVLELCGLLGCGGLAEIDEQYEGWPAGYVEEAEGGADVFAVEAVAVGGSVAGLDGDVFE